jgi:hypothetical protein
MIHFSEELGSLCRFVWSQGVNRDEDCGVIRAQSIDNRRNHRKIQDYDLKLLKNRTIISKYDLDYAELIFD